MTTGASKCLFLFLLSILNVCSSGFFAELSTKRDFEQKELTREEEKMFHSSHRLLLRNFHYKATRHDSIFPTPPITNPVTPPGTIPPDNPAPIIVTVPSTNPATGTPNPASTPLAVPSIPAVPYTNPVYSPVPITNPVTTPSINPGTQPVTNPVTVYPAPSGDVPVTTPVTNPVMPPAATNPPAVPGQSWCVAKAGTSATALQEALDYACGIGRADCSTIQQGGSCYNPNTPQNHASCAFNSYFQKHPVQSSCDFGGTAIITNINPSSSSCIYPLSSSSSSPITVSPTPTTASSSTPITVSPTPTTASSSSPIPVSPAPTTASSTGTAAGPGSGTPSTLNTSNPASDTTILGESPPAVNNSTSMSARLQPIIGCFILVTSTITGIIVLDM